MVTILPKFAPGEDLGKALGSGIGSGLLGAQESHAIQQALSTLDPNAPPQEKLQAIQGLNISPARKQEMTKSMQALAMLDNRKQQQAQQQQQFAQQQEQQQYQFSQQQTLREQQEARKQQQQGLGAQQQTQQQKQFAEQQALRNQKQSLMERSQAFKEQQAVEELAQQQREGPILAKRDRGEKLTEEDRAQLSPTTNRAIMHADATPDSFERESEKLAAKSAHEFYQKVQDEGRQATKQIAEADIAMELNKKGVTGNPFKNKLADVFGEWVRDPESVEFRSRSKQFMEGIKELIGGRITEFEFKFFQNMFPNLDLSQTANKSLLDMVKMREEAKRYESNLSKQIVKKNGGKVPSDLKAQVDDTMEGYMDKKVDTWKKNSYKSILKEKPPNKGEVAVIDDNGAYMFLPKNQASEWQKSGRIVVGQ